MEPMVTVIFDLDGTLLDSLADLHRSVNYALRKHQLPLRSENEIRGFIGNGVYKLMERAVPEGTAKEMVERVFLDFKEYYRAHCRDFSLPYPGITEMLDELKKRNVSTAIFSNKADEMVGVLHQTFFKGLIDVAYGESEKNPKKPCPQAVVNIMQELEATNDLTFYVGDSDVDITTARNAKIASVGVGWGYGDKGKLEQAKADYYIDTPCQLADIIAKVIG